MQEKSITRPLNWEDKEEICKQWQLSGLSMTKFCAQKNLAIATFSGWCARLWPSRRKSKLCPVQITGSQNHTQVERESIVIELSFPHTVTARIEATGSQIRFLLQELLHATTTVR